MEPQHKTAWIPAMSPDRVHGASPVQLHALAFSTTICVLMGLGLLDIAHQGRLEFPPLRDWWMTLPPLYAICLMVARL